MKNYEIENNEITNSLYISENDNDNDITYLYTLIALEARKSKFLKYSFVTNFYELDYQRMCKAIALGSKETLKTKKRRLRTGYVYDEDYVYYFKILYGTYNFGITDVELIESKLEVITNGNNKNIRVNGRIIKEYYKS